MLQLCQALQVMPFAVCESCLCAGPDGRGRMPREPPRSCCQPGLSLQTAAAPAWLPGGINPHQEIIIGDSRGCRAWPVPAALRAPQHCCLITQTLCAARISVPVGVAQGWVSPAATCAHPKLQHVAPSPGSVPISDVVMETQSARCHGSLQLSSLPVPSPL